MKDFYGIVGLADRQTVSRMDDILISKNSSGKGTLFIDDSLSYGIRSRDSAKHYSRSKVTVVADTFLTNKPAIVNKLKASGHALQSNPSDEELVLAAYLEFGEKAIPLLEGAFSLVIKDDRNKKLILARDRFGIKPLLYMMHEGNLAFSSDVKPLIALAKRKVNPTALHYFLNLRYVPSPHTFFEGIHKLPPASMLVIKDDRQIMREYWALHYRYSNYSEEAAAKEIRKMLQASVDSALEGLDEIGIYLSGGIDSSTLVALASRKKDINVKTFTLNFGVAGNESQDALFVADHFNTEHRELKRELNIMDDMSRLLWHAATPKRNLYTFFVAEEASHQVQQVLSGMGSDELFGGYEWKYSFADSIMKERTSIHEHTRKKIVASSDTLLRYLVKEQYVENADLVHELKRWTFLDSNLDLYLTISSMDEVLTRDQMLVVYGNSLKNKKLPDIKEPFRKCFSGGDFAGQIFVADFRIKMADDFLAVDDIVSRSNMIESIAPFLTQQLVDFSSTIPVNYRVRNGKGKNLLRLAMKDALPEKVLNKPKQGFSLDVLVHYEKEIAGYAQELLPQGHLVRNGFINLDYIQKILSQPLSPKLIKHYILVWNLLVAEMWYEMFIETDELRRFQGL
jgi:asparagine synthase (glutamine-hydrolysing)